MGVTVLVFAVELQKVRTKCIFLDFWERTGASFKIECIRFYRIYIELLHLGHNVIKKAFKWKSKWASTSLTWPTRRGSPWGPWASQTQQHAYCLRYAHSQHTESHFGKKNHKRKFSSGNVILIMLLQTLSFTVAILLWAVRDAQCKPSESP